MIVVRAATAWFLAELAVVVRLLRGGRAPGGPVALGCPNAIGCWSVDITAPPSTTRVDWGSGDVGGDIPQHIPRQNPAVFLGSGNVGDVGNVFPGALSRVRARPHMRKGRKNIPNIPQRH